MYRFFLRGHTRLITFKRSKISLVDTFGLELGKNNEKVDKKAALDSILKMPKEEKHLKGLREQRKRKRTRSNALTIASNVMWQVVGNGAAGGARSLLLYSDHNRYLFNCGEGTQRIMQAQTPPRALSQLSNIFFTSRKWARIGGFPGMCLTLRAHGGPDIRVHGPNKCADIFRHVQNFITLFDFDVISHPQNEDYKDQNITVKHIPIKVDTKLTSEPFMGKSWSLKAEHAVKRSPGVDLRGVAIEVTCGAEIDQTAMAYVVTVNPKKGKLNMEKCMELKIPPGPLLGELKAGREIILEDGRTIKPEMVVEAEEAPQVCLVIEAPTLEHAQSLLEKNPFQDHKENLRVVFHFTPSEVVNSKAYKDLLDTFEPNVDQIMVNDDFYGFSSERVVKYVDTFKHIAPDIFPKLMEKVPKKPEEANKSMGVIQSGLRYHIRPNSGFDTEVVEKIDAKQNLVESFKEIEEENNFEQGIISKLASEARKSMKLDESKPEYPKVSFLGTGSSVPSKYRNVSCILVETEPDSYFILDCGEGTLLQLNRLYGKDQAKHILQNLKAIYISHLHADHHLGLINLLLERNKVLEEPKKAFLISTSKIIPFLTAYHVHFESILDNLQLIRNEHLLIGSLKEEFKTQMLYEQIMDEICDSIGLKNIFTCRALHCPHAFSLAFTTRSDDYKVLYTGDTRPHDPLIWLGKKVKRPDLLIHEATLEHKMLKDAMAKNHSTFTEAIEDGKKMDAKFTMLTHFSQRYTKMTRLDEFRDEKNVTAAFDFLSVNPRNLHFVREMYPALEKIVHRDLMLLDNRTFKLGGSHIFADDEDKEEFEIEIGDGKSSQKKRKITF